MNFYWEPDSMLSDWVTNHEDRGHEIEDDSYWCKTCQEGPEDFDAEEQTT